jgi:hypothetical protein
MSRAPFLVVATAAAVALLPSSMVAQGATPRMSALSPTSAMLLVRPESSAYRVTMAPIAAPAPASADTDDDRPSIAGRIVRSAVGVGVGAAVGGWLGYFGAQVTSSDWARISDAEKTSLRQRYTSLGLGVGAITGYFLRPKPHVSRLPGLYNIPARTGRLLLATSELRRSIATRSAAPSGSSSSATMRPRAGVHQRTVRSNRPRSSSTSATRRWARSRRCATSPSPRSPSSASTTPATPAAAGGRTTSTVRSKSCRRTPLRRSSIQCSRTVIE